MIKIEDPSSSEISDVFIPREYWVSDEEATCCFSCKVSFALLHRRHHCRMCGNVFDTKCANNFLTPPTFVFEKEKKIRVCDECHKKAVLYLSRGANTSKKGLSMMIRQSSTRLLEVESLTSELLTGKLYSLSEDILSYFLKDNDCHDKWFVVLKDLIKECMELVQPTNVRCDHIDMKKFIKIKKVPYKDMSLTRLVQGLVIRKNVVNKKMGSSFDNPTILMIKGNLEQNRDNEACVLDANSIKKENAYLEDVVNKILKIDPSIVIIEGTVGRTVQDKLAHLNKALLVRFRKSQFNKIAACVGAQPIEDLYSFEALNPNHLGTCEKFYIAKYKNKEYYDEVRNFRPDEFSDQSDYSMLFLEGCNSIQKRATVLISGPDYQELVKVKKILQETFQILRSLFLERAIISQEALLLHTKDRLWKLLVEDDDIDGADTNNDVRESLKVETYQRERVLEVTPITCLLNQITAATAGYMLNYLTERVPIATIIQKTSFTFSKMLIVPNQSPPLMDLTSKGPEFQPIIESTLKRSKVWYKQDLCWLHKKPKVLRVYYSSKEDATLYIFLSGFAERAFEKCEACNRKYCGHLTFFLIQQYYIQISVDLKSGSKSRRKKHSLSGRELSRSEIGPRIEAHPGSFFNLLTTPAFEAPRKDSSPHSRASSDNAMKMGDVYMYIECCCCKTRLSDVIKLKKAFLNYSFSRYLESLIHSAENYLGYLMDRDFNPKTPGEDYPNEFLQSLKNLPFKSTVKPCCLYSPKNRVFVVDNLLIRFQVGISKPYSVDLSGITSQETAGFCHATEQELIKSKKAEFLELMKNYLRLVNANMNQMLLFLIQNSGLDLSIETIFSAENILNEDNPLTQEPSNILLLSLIPLYKELMDINKEFKETSNKEIHDHLEIDIWRQSFCEHIRNIYDSIEQAKNKYQEATKANKPTRTSSILQSLNEENTENGYFELIDHSSSPVKASQSKDDDFSSRSKDATSIKVEIEALVVNGEYDIQKEAIYAQQATAGACFYLDDLEYEQYMKYKFIPMFENKPLSILAYCLNSPKYMKEVYMAEEFNNFEKYVNGMRQASNVPEYKKFISSKLLCENTENSKQFQVKSPSIEIQLKFFNNLSDSISGRRPKFIPAVVKPRKIFDTEIIEDFVGSIQMGKVPKKELTFSEKYVTPKFNIIIHYPVQFEALRNCCGISLSEFLSSISYSKDWEENNGGRTGASFIKSFDQKFVFKRLERKEFMMLLGFAEEYFRYMWKVCGEGKHSVIAKIYGVFEILDEKQMSCYYIAMENILHNTPSKVKMYDLKGSELNRYVNNNGEGSKTLLDTNYILDRNSQPLPIKSKYHEIIEQAIKNDCEFLCNLKVVDYSLLLVQDEKNGILKMGIIDYLRLYDFEKQIEHMSKKIMKGANPTIIRPEEYKKRFTRAMKRYFMNVSCE